MSYIRINAYEPHPAFAGTAGLLHAWANPVGSIFARLLLWQERVTQRARLAETENYLLDDLGITGAESRREVAKPFWRP